jgi:uncharacterized protein (TIGR03435 family)
MRGRVQGGPGTTDPDRWSSIDTTLRNLVLRAYGLKDYQFAGPAWAEERRFDVEAKLPRGTDMDRFRVMLQTLLEERFQLKCHFERKEILARELTIAKGGAKLQGVTTGYRLRPGPFSWQPYDRGAAGSLWISDIAAGSDGVDV